MSPTEESVEKINWDDAQEAVIEAEPEARVLVEAGPGTGKTAVACGRVAWLVREQDVEPGNILLISFTRTAVAELRGRISTYIGNEAKAAAVRISTLDSTAWHLRYGFDDAEIESLFGDFDANIESVIDMLTRDDKDQDLLDYLQRLEHLVVDEAQDLTSIRARLVLELIGNLDPQCGVTIFADPAQAIYGFTTDDEDSEIAAETFLHLLSKAPGEEFITWPLDRVYRTDSEELLRIMQDLRKTVQESDLPEDEMYDCLREDLLDQSRRVRLDRRSLPGAVKGKEDLLILYRRRAEVLLTSSLLCSSGVLHRLRLSGLPACIQPWIAHLLWDFADRTLDRDEFTERWEERDGDSLSCGLSITEAWKAIYGIAGLRQGGIDMRKLRQKLSRSRPPVEVCLTDCGIRGPIIGTIHASKGREAGTVYLCLPKDAPEEACDEESRVLYVGATRARNELGTDTGGRVYASSLDTSGRAFCLQPKRERAQFEIGREQDLDVNSPVSKNLHRTSDVAQEVQREFARRHGKIHEAEAYAIRAWDYRYRLYFKDEDKNRWIGQLSKAVNDDAWFIANMIHSRRMKPPTQIRHIFFVAAQTVVLAPDDPRLETIHSPYNETGMFLAPVLRAWTFLYLRQRR